MANVCLIVIDGWGISEHVEGNAILNAKTPVMDGLAKRKGQYVTLDASGLAVGLPAGLMGNSEVGHFTIGTGRVTYQDIVAINKSIKERSFHTKPNLLKMFARAKSKNGRVHFLGLRVICGQLTVLLEMYKLLSLLEAAKQDGVPNSFVHFFSDGRDTSPTSAVNYVKQLQDHMSQLNYGSLATLTGRYYAMDRDKRYERTKIAYDGIVSGVGQPASPDHVIEVMKERYNGVGDAKMTDEFMKPIIVDKSGLVQSGDTLLFIDFRADRMRQIVEAFGVKPQFTTDVSLQDLEVVTMTEYKKEYPFNNLFPSEVPQNTLAEWLSKKSVSQFHCAETEKYAHVTFFFNGGVEQPFDKEDRLMVPSPKVATYDLQPEMSVAGVGQAVADAVASGKYPFVMCNLAPPDMVGHTGVYKAAVPACEATDEAIGVILKSCETNGYTLLVTADHGNAETMIDEDGNPVTKHTTNRVPFNMASKDQVFKVPADHNATLSDVAPTILHLMGIDQPVEMTGISLI